MAFQSSELPEYTFEDPNNISNIIGRELDNILANHFHPYVTLQILFLEEDLTKTFLHTLHFQLNFQKTNLTGKDLEDVIQLSNILLPSTNKTLLGRKGRTFLEAQTQLEQNPTASNNRTKINRV